MRRPPRGLTPDEAAVWAKVAATVQPLGGRRPQAADQVMAAAPVTAAPAIRTGSRPQPAPTPPAPPDPPRARPLDRHGLDASWERKLAKAALAPDFTLDLHGHSLEAAHARLEHGLTQALAQGARLLLLITGRPRPADSQTLRGERRGAIRAKVLDWLAAGSHAHRIAAVRQAHPRHGGAGALYIVLRRPR